MTHDTQYLTISQEEANRVDEEAKRRLLASRKLSLVVDLDQTIIHAAVDPTIAEWQNDKDNPNYEAVKDVRAFQLIDDGPGMRGCWYYIKLRPGLMDFLENVSQIYELHIYTMGTRQYAQQIANIVDPDRKYFGERILSRDESGSMVAKNLERLFPVDTKMVVIIDDRGDVWKWSANLIRVTPFDFFVGIGDINSSFLPKKQEIQATPKAESATADASDETSPETSTKTDAETATNGTAENGTSNMDSDTSALEQLVAMGGADNPIVREIQSKDQEDAITSQRAEKPLLKMQRQQDERDAKSEAAAAADSTADFRQPESLTNGDSQMTTDSDSSDSSSESSNATPLAAPKAKARHSILRNDDQELVYLESRLVAVHAAFFNEYDRKRLGSKGGRVAALTGKRKIPLSSDVDDTPADLLLVPDVKKLMPAMKTRVLGGVTIVFSGVLPLGTDVQNADIPTWAKTFGATIADKLDDGATHVIAARAGTVKVKQAKSRGIKVVGTAWLFDSIQQWRKMDERAYLISDAAPKPIEGSNEIAMAEGNYDLNEDPSSLVSSEDDDTTGVDTEDEAGQPDRKKLRLDTGRVLKEGQDVVDDKSPLTIDADELADIDAELKEFMGSDAESDSDADSIASALSVRLGKRKRPTGDESGAEESDADGDGERSRPKDRGGGTRLRKVANAESTGDSTPAANGDAEDRAIRAEQRVVERAQMRMEAEVEESDDELLREMEANLESAGESDGGEEGFMGPTASES